MFDTGHPTAGWTMASEMARHPKNYESKPSRINWDFQLSRAARTSVLWSFPRGTWGRAQGGGRGMCLDLKLVSLTELKMALRNRSVLSYAHLLNPADPKCTESAKMMHHATTQLQMCSCFKSSQKAGTSTEFWKGSLVPSMKDTCLVISTAIKYLAWLTIAFWGITEGINQIQSGWRHAFPQMQYSQL